MYGLVERVEDYPARFAWCLAATVVEREPDHVTVRLEVRHAGITTAWTTRNALAPHESIGLELVDGPFTALKGAWHFRPLGETGCKVSLDLHYAVASKLVGSALAIGFKSLADRMVDDFVRAALAGQ